MSHILLIISSPRGAASYSSKVARSLAEKLAGGDAKAITVRDLARWPLRHIGEDFVVALSAPAENRTGPQQAAIDLSDELVKELFAADVIVIASAMINFGLSTNLKTWIDYIVQASGGVYSEGPMVPFNFGDTYLKRILGFIGITDVEVIAIEGVAYGPEVAEKAVSAALAKVSAVRPHRVAAAS